MNRLTTICTTILAVAILPLYVSAQSSEQSNSFSESVVLVRTEMHGSGSGVIIDANHVVTAHHVVANDSRIRVETDSGFITAKVITSDIKNDIAILKLDSPISEPALHVRNQPLSLTETIRMFGHAEGRWNVSESTGKVIGIQSDDGAVSWIRISAPVTHGMSGGPAIDTAGDIAAIIVAVTLENSKPTHAMLAPNHALVKLVSQINEVISK